MCFDAAERSGEGLRGTLVMIRQSPFDIAGYFAGEGRAHEPGRAVRADAWRDVTRRNRAGATTLRALGTAPAADLMYHGYVLAMAHFA